ncbi:MAG: hypothetical protein EFT35_01600 [Methanophagales archaeon ANME-1-THS]|nr:MAG: hypothetical protein EFT35_01600 [Methanophagales archaeon ANME-1-THS]
MKMSGELTAATAVIYFSAYILAVVAGHCFVRGILRRYSLPEEGGLEGAGALIGILERLFTLTLVLVGQYMALGLILTAKSIARFEDLKNRKFAEYYLIGTLSSMLVAIFIGIFTLWVVKIV